jgi:hypothetical protein
MRIVASMTTIPSRIDKIRPVVEAVLAQSVPVEHLEMNIPYHCLRTDEAYTIPPWLQDMERVKIFRTEDYGAITKVAPTLLRYKDDQTTYIFSLDDDCAFPANQLELICRAHRPDIRRILVRYGGVLNPDGTVQNWWGEAPITWFEGFGGVLYPPACVGDDFLDYVVATSANSDCRSGDDLVLSMYFNHIDLPIYLRNIPSEAPYMVSGWLSHSTVHALSQGGHAEKYKRVFAFVNSLRAAS